MFSSWFIVVLILIFTMNDEWIFSLSTIFLNQTILKIFKSSWSFALFFINLLIIIFWLFIFNMMHTSCVSITKLLYITYVKLIILFIYFWNLFKAAQVFKLIICSVMFSLLSLQSNMIKFYCIINTVLISWKIWLINFFCIFFIFFLFAIFIRILYSLQNNDILFLNCCFLIVAFSLVTLIYNNDLNVKYMFFYIYNCLLKSWINVFNFYTFFVINTSWFSILLSEMFWKY